MVTGSKSLIEAVIGSAFERAAQRAGAGDLAHGLLAALRRIRLVVDAQVGYSGACQIDDGIQDILVQRALAAYDSTAPEAMPLPPFGPSTARAVAILEDAAMSCLALNAWFPGNSAVSLAVAVLTSRLVDCLGGVPDRDTVFSRLRKPASPDDDTVDEDRWSTLAVH